MADARICVRISQAIAPFPIVAAVAPALDQGETEDNPKPAPKASNTRANEAETKAPPMTAAQDTPDRSESFLPGTSAIEVGESITGRSTADCCIREFLHLSK